MKKNLVNCKYYDISQIKNRKTCHYNKSVSLVHLKMCTLLKNFDNSQLLIQLKNIDLNVTAISELRINEKKPSVVDINLPN